MGKGKAKAKVSAKSADAKMEHLNVTTALRGRSIIEKKGHYVMAGSVKTPKSTPYSWSCPGMGI